MSSETIAEGWKETPRLDFSASKGMPPEAAENDMMLLIAAQPASGQVRPEEPREVF